MSSECRGGNAAQAAPVYTVYPVPGGNGGNVNYGFHQSNPHAPPPKYEDVISGEYLKWNQQSHHDPGHPPNAACQCSCSHAHTITSQADEEAHEANKCNSVKYSLFAFFMAGILWSATKMFW